MKILRQCVAWFVGMFAAALTVALIEGISSQLHRSPPNLDPGDPEAMAKWVATLPVTAFLMLIVAWGAGAYVGTVLARILSVGRSLGPAIGVALVLTIATIANLIMLPHPWWLWPLGLGANLGMGLLGMALSGPPSTTSLIVREIQAPRDKVFRALSETEEYSRAVPEIVKVEILSEQSRGAGTKFRETRRMHNREVSSELEVTEYREPELIRFATVTAGTLWETTFRLLDKGQRVEVRTEVTATPRSIGGRIAVLLLNGLVCKGIESDLKAIQKFVESNAPTTSK